MISDRSLETRLKPLNIELFELKFLTLSNQVRPTIKSELFLHHSAGCLEIGGRGFKSRRETGLFFSLTILSMVCPSRRLTKLNSAHGLSTNVKERDGGREREEREREATQRKTHLRAKQRRRCC